jgi:rhodanese-related sulfurtransferase
MLTLTLTIVFVGAILSAAEPTKDSLEAVKQHLREKKAVLIDVREKEEWDKGHLENAIHLPLSRIAQGLTENDVNQLAPKDSILYLHCAAGVRCLKATDLLAKYPRDYRPLKPGYRELLQAGFPPSKP